ncbi:alpha/beta fold hydrolase [Nesterenkonia muleiensis]|uniref:alpha/beta fold hydrolase n=1 Tax=Nesterenkonia muleiensis TaxID=2282648 RepID=UPI000E72D969|nr:alpha/beta fold hydrolase [Nesterenkonia muleiensis]
MSEVRELLDGTRIVDHWVTVPLDWENAAGETIDIYAREFIGAEALAKGEAHVSSLPYLLFLQGGPGGKGNRPAKLSGWMTELATDFRILMLDQRGTGLSARLDRHSLAAHGSPTAQAEHLRNFRADSIVRDAEALREALGIESWTVFGQSYGGFCTLTYLSFAPEHLDRALITGGLAPLTGHAERVYQHTYPRMAARNAEYFARFPEDRERLNDVVAHLRTHHVRLLDGSPLTVARLQLLGLLLGGNTKVDTLHYLLEEAFTGPSRTRLSDTFLNGAGQQISFAGNPMYAVMHESIYGQPAELSGGSAAISWASERVREHFPAFSPDADSPLLLGEMILREHVRLDPVLAPLYETAEQLAAVDDWPALYDLEQLARNTVPAAAAVYTDDVFVSRELSLETAARVANLQVWETVDFHHDGIHEDGKRVLRTLLELTGH